MSKRMEKMKMQTDLKKLQNYLSSLQTFEANLEIKHSELNDALESTGESKPRAYGTRTQIQVILLVF